ncbi:MAG TPA: hypothetical protein VLF14_06095 [Candidatus Binatia bacterium]|nr:hypothetical protein [Candidatus Binatia bacterium]
MRIQAGGALVVAGWLLMSPPLVKDAKAPGGFRLDSSAKVADWNQVSAHDSATDCERAKAQKAVDAISMTERIAGKKDVLDEPLVNEALHALCVPADYLYGSSADDEGECPAGPAQL